MILYRSIGRKLNADVLGFDCPTLSQVWAVKGIKVEGEKDPEHMLDGNETIVERANDMLHG